MYAMAKFGREFCEYDKISSLVLFILTRKHRSLFCTGSVKGSEGRACAAALFMHP